MIKKLVALSIAFLIVNSITAQNDSLLSQPIHQIGVVLGSGYNQIRDDILAPLRWDGLSFVGGFSYSKVSTKALHNIDLRIPYSSLTNRYDHEADAYELNLGYSYLRKIENTKPYGQIYVGGLIDWSCNLQLYDTWDDSHLYWLNVYELGPIVRWKPNFPSNHHLSFNLNFPLLALVSRPPEFRYYDQEKLPAEILSKPHENMKFNTINKYISLGLQCKYIYPLSAKLALETSYLSNFKTFSEPRRISIFSNTLQLKLLFTLGKMNKEKE
jgi:hypothetical protein